MSDLNELTKAFQLLDHYEAYHIKKAWGVMILLFGIFDLLDWSLLFLHSSEMLLIPYYTWQWIFQGEILLKALTFLIVLFKQNTLKRPLHKEGEFRTQQDEFLGLALVCMGRFPTTFLIFIIPQIRSQQFSDAAEGQGVFLVVLSGVFKRLRLNL